MGYEYECKMVKGDKMNIFDSSGHFFIKIKNKEYEDVESLICLTQKDLKKLILNLKEFVVEGN